MDALDHVRRRLLQVADDPSVRSVVVDLGADEVAGEEVAHDAERQLRLLVHERGSRRVLRLRLDRLPEALQEDEVALDVLGRRALGCRTDDDPAALRVETLDDLLEARALGVLEATRDARPLAVRHVDEEAPGQRDLGRQAGALRLHRVLDRLDHDRLAALDQILDLPRALPALELGPDDLVDVEEPVLLEADLDERGLHPGEDVVDDSEVDVARDRAALRALEVDLGDPVVLEDRDPLLADVDRDDELALRGGQRCALRRRSPPAAARGGLRSGLPSAFAGCLRGASGPSPAATGSSPRRRPRVGRRRRSPASSFPRRRGYRGGVSSSGRPASCGSSLRAPVSASRRASGGASTSGGGGFRAACFFLLLAEAKPASCQGVNLLSCDRARAPESHRLDRPRAAWVQDVGRHDLRTGYQSAFGRPASRAASHAAAGRSRARRARTARRRWERRAHAHGSSSAYRVSD